MKTTSNLFEDVPQPYPQPYRVPGGPRCVEADSFPFEDISKIAEQESWRKEVNRPIYHIHKWWAQRLGSVFRALVIATFKDQSADLLNAFYGPTRIDGAVVLDPFMGSGTTLGEVLKLGGTAIGQDINPVAYFLVSNALNLPHASEVVRTYQEIESDTAPQLLNLYSTVMPTGQTAQVLYYFWVKVVQCPRCDAGVDLFPSYVFASNAYPNQRPEVRIVCPRCGDIHTGTYGVNTTRCPQCELAFNPLSGPAGKAEAKCVNCDHTFRIKDAVRRHSGPPRHRLYAKLVLSSDGQKVYLPTTADEVTRYEQAEQALALRDHAFPLVEIRAGYNTDQVLNYGYRFWHEMFNARQLLALSLLGERIRRIADERQRQVFCCLFSGVLEFNNMFASYKGEGTGAVRHMFAHHVLKPERTPIEANIWGTPKSSGAFSTMFDNRLIRAIDYAENPFELRPASRTSSAKKVFDISLPLTLPRPEGRLSLSCGDSSKMALPNESVDAVITDPPFFDNVHYSELADFFYVWQRYVLGGNGFHANDTTRSVCEVQHENAQEFERRLVAVWMECRRVLKASGLLVFTFHHSRSEGWKALLGSIAQAGFEVVNVHPIKSEMAVAVPKYQAKAPITFDVVFVCRQRRSEGAIAQTVVTDAKLAAERQLRRLQTAGFALSDNDIRLLVTSQVVKRLSVLRARDAINHLRICDSQMEEATRDLIATAKCAAT